MSVAFYLIAVVIGIVTGGITSLIGASGVMIIVPVLTMFFHVSGHAAIGTSLFVDVIASIVVSYTYFKNGNIELRSGIWIAIASIAGAQLGALFSSEIKEGPLSAMFGGILVISGVGLIIKSYKEKGEPKESKIKFTKKWQRVVACIIIGIGLGILSGLFGAGGGVMILLALIVIMSYPLHKAIGTSTLIMAMTALSSMAGYACRGYIDLILGCFLSIGAVIGGILGSKYANSVNEKVLQKVVGVCFVCLGFVMTVMEVIKLK